MKLLLVEDDLPLGALVKQGIESEGHQVEWVQSAASATTALLQTPYDCMLLDLGLPDLPGEHLLAAMRAKNDQTPVIVITARGQMHDRISLLDCGADDYMIKPIDLDELMARIRAAVRRTKGGEKRDTVITCGPLELHPYNLTATWHGDIVPLSKKEFWVLETFTRTKGEVLSLRQLEEILYGFGDEVGSNAVQVHIHYLRQKFSEDIIVTVRGEGYRFGLPRTAE